MAFPHVLDSRYVLSILYVGYQSQTQVESAHGPSALPLRPRTLLDPPRPGRAGREMDDAGAARGLLWSVPLRRLRPRVALRAGRAERPAEDPDGGRHPRAARVQGARSTDPGGISSHRQRPRVRPRHPRRVTVE